MPDKIEGHLEVGINDDGEVVVNHGDLKPDENGVGHIVFSPDQARHLADLLLKHARAGARLLRRRERGMGGAWKANPAKKAAVA